MILNAIWIDKIESNMNFLPKHFIYLKLIWSRYIYIYLAAKNIKIANVEIFICLFIFL